MQGGGECLPGELDYVTDSRRCRDSREVREGGSDDLLCVVYLEAVTVHKNRSGL